jgi:hypothetical protein
VEGSWEQIPATKMYSIAHKLQLPNLLQKFEVKSNHESQDTDMTCSASGTGLSVMTVGLSAKFTVSCKDSLGGTVNSLNFASQFRCSLLDLNPSLDLPYASQCNMELTGSSIIISMVPSSMHHKIMLGVLDDVGNHGGFWATYYSSSNWTNPTVSKSEIAIDFSHSEGTGPIATLNSSYSIRWRGFCMMPSSGPMTMSFSKSAGTYHLMTDERALNNSEPTAVQIELLYSLTATSDNIVKLEWTGLDTVTSKVSSFLKAVLDYGKASYGDSQQLRVVPGFCSLKHSSLTGAALATVGVYQYLTLILVDLFQNSCSESNVAIAAHAVGRDFQTLLFAKLPNLQVAWTKEDLYSINVALGKSGTGPEMILFQDTACSIKIHQSVLERVDFDPTEVEKSARCIQIEGIIELSVSTNYSLVARVDMAYLRVENEVPCSINLTVWGVGSNISSNDDTSTSAILSSVLIQTSLTGFIQFSLKYIHAQNCNRLRLMLASLNEEFSMSHSLLVDSSNSGIVLESRLNAMRILVVSSSVTSMTNVDTLSTTQNSVRMAGNSSVESFTFSCRNQNNLDSVCPANDFHASICTLSKGRRCYRPTDWTFQSSQSARFMTVITIASAYKQSVAITAGVGLWATYYEDAYFNSPFVSFVMQSALISTWAINSSSFFVPIAGEFSAKWAGFIKSNSQSITTITADSITQNDVLTVWIDNFKALHQKFMLGIHSATVSLRSGTLFEVEIEYKHLGIGPIHVNITMPSTTLHFLKDNNSQKHVINVKPEISSTCRLVSRNGLITLVTIGIPVSFSLSCQDQFQNAINEINSVSAYLISGENSSGNPEWSHNLTFTNGVVDVVTVVHCCVSVFSILVGVDHANFTSNLFKVNYSPPAETHSLFLGPGVLTFGFPSIFTVYPRDVWNFASTYGNSTFKLFLSHVTISDMNSQRIDRSLYDISSAYSMAGDSQSLQLTPYINNDRLLIHHEVCKMGYLVRVFSTDHPTKASLIQELVLLSIKDLNVYQYVFRF